MTDHQLWDERRKMMFHFASVLLDSCSDTVTSLPIEAVADQAARLADALLKHIGPAPAKGPEAPGQQQPTPDEYAAMVFSAVSKQLGDKLHESAACLKEAARKAGRS
jgi:hypothetical protein